MKIKQEEKKTTTLKFKTKKIKYIKKKDEIPKKKT